MSTIEPPTPEASLSSRPKLRQAIPVVLVDSVEEMATFFREQLGFAIDFLHGRPPFYGSVSRDAACLHLRFVRPPVVNPERAEQEELLAAFLSVDDVKALHAEFTARNVPGLGRLKTEPWGGTGFTVRAPDGNRIYFSG